MTEINLIERLFSSIDDEISIGSKVLVDIIDSSFDYFSRSELQPLKAQMVDFLATDPSDETLARLWRRNSHTTTAYNPRKLVLLLEMALSRLEKRLK